MARSLVGLAVGLVTLTVLGGAFGEVTEAIVKQDDIAALDSPVTRWLVVSRTPWLTRTMQVVTELGSAWFIILLMTLVTGGLLARSGTRRLAGVPPVSAAGAALPVLAVKLVIARPRPTIGAIVAAAGKLLVPVRAQRPGGGDLRGAGKVTMHLAPAIPRWRIWSPPPSPCSSASHRLYLGVHWLSDVVGGWVLGAAWLVLTVGALTAGPRACAAATRPQSRTESVTKRRIVAGPNPS